MSDANTDKSIKGRALAVLQKLMAMSRPAKILLGTTVAATIIVGTIAFRWATNETYALLFAQMTPEDSAAVVEKLKELKVPYRVADGGKIEVPEARVHELRLDIAGAGLLRGGGVGFEAFDKMRMGATEFEQQVMFRRAMEGELSRTIASVGAVETARVHLVLPQRSVFVEKTQAGSASVVVKLRAGREIGPQEATAIVHLVAASVPGLAPEHVALATTEGKLIRKPKSGNEDGSDADEDALSDVKVLEAKLEERARAILGRVVGPDHVDVKVAAEIDLSKVERNEEHYDKGKTALRSEELLIEKNQTAGDSAAGVPGAESNLPTGDEEEVADAPGAAGVLRREHTRNFEVDKVTERTISKSGRIKRLTVAVVVDGVQVAGDDGVTRSVARTPEELEQLASLAKSAIGIDERRNDVLTIDSIPFFAAPDTADKTGETGDVAATEDPRLLKVKKYAPVAAAALLLLIVATALVMRRRRKLKALRSSTAAALLVPTAEQSAGALGTGASDDLKKLDDPRDEAMRRALSDPATAALVIRHWLGADEQEESQNKAA